MFKGIMTGCDARQEWMLKWWWNNYSKNNDYPIIFWDFGMSPAAKSWCEKKGIVKTFNQDLELKESSDAPWGKNVSQSVWNRRAVWFYKALLLENTPFEQTIWTDLDCEIKENLAPLFEMAQSKSGFAISYDSKENIQDAQKNGTLKEGVQGIQAGVFAYTKNSPLISAWKRYCMTHLEEEASDQTALSHLLQEEPFDITIFSNKYNWLTPEAPLPGAAILHHNGASRKRSLLTKMSF